MNMSGSLAFRLFCIALLTAFSVSFSTDAASLSVTPSTLSNTYAGVITLQISGLNSGETVLVERFVDANANGSIDTNDWLCTSFLVTDGQVTSFGGVRNINIPGDQDAVAGQITTSLSFLNSPELSRVAGPQFFRVSSPTSRFSPVVQPLTVTQFAYSQMVTGTVTSGASPVPHAGVGLLALVGNNAEFVVGALADASGHYSVRAPANNYAVVAVKPGLVSPFGFPIFTLSPNQTLATNLNMTPGPYVLSGTVSDASTSAGLPGIQLLLQSISGYGALGFTDGNGNFSIPVTPDTWKVDLSDYSVTALGYLRPQTKPRVTVTSSNVSGSQVALAKMTAMVYGTVKNDTNAALAGISMFGSDNVGQNQSSAYTDANGNYSIGVLAGGNWTVGPDSAQPALAGYTVLSTNVVLSTGTALQVNFVAQATTAHLVGHVYTNGIPVAGVTLLAIPQTGGSSVASAVSAADGSFDLGVPGGNWTITLETTSAAALNIIGPALNVTIANGTTLSGINYIAQNVTGSLTGSVKDSSSKAISGIFVFVNATVNGTNYNAGAQTDANGNYSIGLFNGIWQVSVDCGGLNALGYGCPNNQSVTVNGAGAVANFVVPPPASYIFYLRQFAYGGEFGTGLTPTVAYPVTPAGYTAVLLAENAANYPPAGNVFFTGPAGSGMNNTATAGQNLGGNSAAYISDRVNTPASGPGGTWTVNYSGTFMVFSVPDPQVSTHLVVPIPTVTLSNNILTGVTWRYTDTSGNPLSGTPAVVTNFQVATFDRDLNALDVSALLAPSVMSYAPASVIQWSNVGRIRMFYIDSLNNRYMVNFNRSIPGLASAGFSPTDRFQLALSGLVGQNYTVQFSTTLTNWTTLLITNAPASSFTVIDPTAPGSDGFYRILLGP